MNTHNKLQPRNETEKVSDSLNQLRETASEMYGRIARNDSLQTDLEHREVPFGVSGKAITDFNPKREQPLVEAIEVKSAEQLADGAVTRIDMKMRDDGLFTLVRHARRDDRSVSGNLEDSKISLLIDYSTGMVTGSESMLDMNAGKIINRDNRDLSKQDTIAAAESLLAELGERVDEATKSPEEEGQSSLVAVLGSGAVRNLDIPQ